MSTPRVVSWDPVKQELFVDGETYTARELMAMPRQEFKKLLQPGLRRVYANALAQKPNAAEPASKLSQHLSRTELQERSFLMSPRFEPDMEKTRASTRIFERGEYEVVCQAPQGMLYEKDNGDVVAGVRYPLVMAGRIAADGNLEEEGDWGEAGEDVTPIRLYVHTDAAWPMSKQFVMSAMGFTLEEEEEFNEEFVSEHSFAVDGDPASEDDPELGSAWEQVEGQRVWLTLDVDTYQGRKQQTHGSYQPVGGN